MRTTVPARGALGVLRATAPIPGSSARWGSSGRHHARPYKADDAPPGGFPSGELANVGRVRMVLAMTLAGLTVLSGCSAGAPPAPSAPGAIAPGNSTPLATEPPDQVPARDATFLVRSNQSLVVDCLNKIDYTKTSPAQRRRSPGR